MVRDIFEDRGCGADDGVGADGDTGAYEGSGGDPCEVVDDDGSGVEGVERGLVVVGGGAEVGVLGDGDLVAEGYLAGVVDDGVGAEGGVLTDYKVPGRPNLSGCAYLAMRSYLGAKQTKDAYSPAVEERQGEGANEDGVADVPRETLDAIAEGVVVDVFIELLRLEHCWWGRFN